MPTCDTLPLIEVESMEHPIGEGRVELEFAIQTATDGEAITQVEVELDGQPIAIRGPDDAGRYRYSNDMVGLGKHRISIRVQDAAGRSAQPVDLPFWIENEAFDYRDGVLYLLFIDRFANGNPDNDAPLDDARVFPIANWFGGDLEGATMALENGYFDALGVSTIWLSPVNLQIDRSMKARSSDHQIAPYHGYWPVRAREVEPRFGGAQALKAFVKSAHDRGIWVPLTSSIIKFTKNTNISPTIGIVCTDCVCGTPGCGWSEKPLSCLFAEYLPDIDWTQPGA